MIEGVSGLRMSSEVDDEEVFKDLEKEVYIYL